MTPFKVRMVEIKPMSVNVFINNKQSQYFLMTWHNCICGCLRWLFQCDFQCDKSFIPLYYLYGKKINVLFFIIIFIPLHNNGWECVAPLCVNITVITVQRGDGLYMVNRKYCGWADFCHPTCAFSTYLLVFFFVLLLMVCHLSRPQSADFVHILTLHCVMV